MFICQRRFAHQFHCNTFHQMIISMDSIFFVVFFKLWVSMGWIKTDEPKAITKGLSEFDSSNGAEGIENESVKIKLWIGRAEDICYLLGQAVLTLFYPSVAENEGKYTIDILNIIILIQLCNWSGEFINILEVMAIGKWNDIPSGWLLN